MKTRTWGPYILESVSGAGSVGYARTGTKVHFIHAWKVIGYTEGFVWTNRYCKIGQFHSACASCNGNGQHVGQINPKLTIENINCQKCRKIVGLES